MSESDHVVGFAVRISTVNAAIHIYRTPAPANTATTDDFVRKLRHPAIRHGAALLLGCSAVVFSLFSLVRILEG